MEPNQIAAYKILEQAQQALKSGDKATAQHLAEIVSQKAPELEEVWLLMAALATPRDSLSYLEKALVINPHSERAHKGLVWAHARVDQETALAGNPGGVEAIGQTKSDVIPVQEPGTTTAEHDQQPLPEGSAVVEPAPLKTKSSKNYRYSVIFLSGLVIIAAVLFFFWQRASANQFFTDLLITRESGPVAADALIKKSNLEELLPVVTVSPTTVLLEVTAEPTLVSPTAEPNITSTNQPQQPSDAGSAATETQVPPADTAVPASVTSVPPTPTTVPPTATSVPATATMVPPTATLVSPTEALLAPTFTALPTDSSPFTIPTLVIPATLPPIVLEATLTPIVMQPTNNPPENSSSAATPTALPTDTAPAPLPTSVPYDTPAVITGSTYGGAGHWIDVDLTNQMVYAYDGNNVVNSFLVSTGTWLHPTVTGQFHIYVKYTYTEMVGDDYDLPNVPNTMYFYEGYALHGTYWHSNFGTPMSHGCVNLSIPDSAWLFQFASVGTLVNVHY